MSLYLTHSNDWSLEPPFQVLCRALCVCPGLRCGWPIPKSPCGTLLRSCPHTQPGTQLTHSGDGPAVGHEAKAVLEDTSAMEEGEGDTHDLVQLVLNAAQPGARGVLNLVK